MATLGEINAWVASRLRDSNYTAVSEQSVTDMINQAIRYWKNRRFTFNERTDTTTLFQGDPQVLLPDTWFLPSIDESFVLQYSGIRYPLKKISEPMYNDFYLSNGVGQPWYFARLANTEYQVFPIPDRDYTLLRFYLRDYDALVENADTNDFTDHAQDLVQYTAAAYGSRDLRQDLNMYEAFYKQAELEYKNLLTNARKANATGSLTTYSTFNTY